MAAVVAGLVLASVLLLSGPGSDARAGVTLKRDWGPARSKPGNRVIAAAPGKGGVIYTATESGRVRQIGSGSPKLIAEAGFWTNDLTVGPDGSIFVLTDESVSRYSAKGRLLNTLGDDDQPRNARVDSGSAVEVTPDGTVLVAEAEEGCITRFETRGEFLGRWCGEGKRKLGYPSDITVDADGSVLVVDTNRYVVRKLDREGKPAGLFGQSGWLKDRIYSPYRIAADREGRIFITDWSLNRIQVFTSDGEFIEQWGRTGYGKRHFDWIEGLAASSKGRVLVTDVWGVREFQLNDRPATRYAGIGAGTLDWNVAAWPGRVARVPMAVVNFGESAARDVTFCYRHRYLSPRLTTDGPRCRRVGTVAPDSSKRFSVQVITPARSDSAFDPMGYDFDVVVRSRNGGSVLVPSNVWVKRKGKS